jgi:DNA polymerase III epsilon subunit-like protein
MIDIETLGLEAGAAIVSIGAVEFGPGRLGETFEASISLSSCQEAGLNIDADTLEWWLEQSEEAQAQLAGGDNLGTVLTELSMWLRERSVDEVWANSPAFDCDMLEHAADRVGVTFPWAYYDRRDYRTLTSLPQAPDDEHDGVAHDALDDAKHQAQVAATTLRRLEAAAVEVDR